MKKLICSLLTLSLALLALTASYTEEGTDIELLRAADVNADRIINILDLVLIASHLGETSTADQPLSSDVNGDSNVNILDLVLVASYLGETVRPPVVFVSADPAIDSEITVNDTITLTFDNSPEDVTVSEGIATITDNTVTIAGPFTPGTLEMTITWADSSETLNYTVRQPADFVSAEPAVDSEITTNDSITLTFDHPPEDVTVSEGAATISDNTVTIAGPFTPGALDLKITWEDGTETLSYTIRPLVAFTGAEPESGAKITTNDTITLTFDHPPEDVAVNTGVATTNGNTVTITGPFTPGALDLKITWEDGTEKLSYTIRPFVAFVKAKPKSGAKITTNDTVTLTFDNSPKDVTVSEGVAITKGKTVTITGPFTPGALDLKITWEDGTETLSYTIRPFVAFVKAKPKSGAKITTNDTITLTFDHPPEDVAVNTGVATTDGNTVTITGPFTPGTLNLKITWEDGTEKLSYTIRSPIAFVSIEPTVDSPLTVDSSITLTFDNRPRDVTVNTGVATTKGKTVTITGPFTPGALELTITWADGSLTFTYTVAAPDTEVPSITGGTISDGDTKVDPSATIEIEFSEEVSGTIALQTEAGDDVGWTGTIEGKKARLELVKGKELGHETTAITYMIVGKVEDAAGNETDINITFTTAPQYDGIPIEVTDATFDSIVLESEIPIVVEFYTDW